MLVPLPPPTAADTAATAADVCLDDIFVCSEFALSADSIDVVRFRSSSVGEDCFALPDVTGPIPIPRGWQEAVDDPLYGKRWRAAMEDDIKGKFTDNKAWDLVTSIPHGRKAMKGKWVFKVIYKPARHSVSSRGD